MFQAWEVKITKIEASSRPSRLLGMSVMKKVSAIGRKTKMGIDWRMSRMGTSTFSARRSLRRGSAVHQGEDGRKGEGDEHPQKRSRRVVRHVCDVGRDGDRGAARGEVDRHRLAQPHHRVEDGNDPGPDHDVRGQLILRPRSTSRIGSDCNTATARPSRSGIVRLASNLSAATKGTALY